MTSSAGRLFDAVSSLIGVRDEIEFEGQAAIELEMISDEGNHGRYEYRYLAEQGKPAVVDTDPVIKGIVNDLLGGVPAAVIGAKFHETVAAIIIETCRKLKDAHDINTVALSGGVFQNSILYGKVVKGLKEQGFRLLLHKELPVNDGGISLGQAIIAYTIAAKSQTKD
jgi:hydrogenase maturation protein HypF